MGRTLASSMAPRFPSLPNNPGPSLFPFNSSRTLPALPPTIDTAGPNTTIVVSPGGSSSHLTLTILLAVLITLVLALLFGILIFFITRKRNQYLQWPSMGKNSKDTMPFRCFNYREIQKATDNFSTIIGKGRFGTVYKAVFDDGFVGAVKMMQNLPKYEEKQVCKEMELLGRLHHRHIVVLRGFCITNTERFLIYDYMENGSLREHLHAGESMIPIDWNTRMQIAKEIAVALEYLHFLCDPPVCHGDIKSSNILLDEYYTAKVADFSLAHNSRIRGSSACMHIGKTVTSRQDIQNDVYNYGILLMELITGEECSTQNTFSGIPTTETKVSLMVDNNLEDNYDIGEARGMFTLAQMCTTNGTSLNIRKVLAFLNEILTKESASGFTKAGTRSSDVDVTSSSSYTFASITDSAKAYVFDTIPLATFSDRLLKE